MPVVTGHAPIPEQAMQGTRSLLHDGTATARAAV
jgi:hypothetical protein